MNTRSIPPRAMVRPADEMFLTDAERRRAEMLEAQRQEGLGRRLAALPAKAPKWAAMQREAEAELTKLVLTAEVRRQRKAAN